MGVFGGYGGDEPQPALFEYRHPGTERVDDLEIVARHDDRRAGLETLPEVADQAVVGFRVQPDEGLVEKQEGG